MSRIIDALRQQRTRGYLYRTITAGGAVALFYGLISAQEVAVWSGLVATLFGLPAANTPVKKENQ